MKSLDAKEQILEPVSEEGQEGVIKKTKFIVFQ